MSFLSRKQRFFRTLIRVEFVAVSLALMFISGLKVEGVSFLVFFLTLIVCGGGFKGLLC